LYGITLLRMKTENDKSLIIKDPISIKPLTTCLNDTSATYKFYWFISLLEEVENKNFLIKKQDIFAGMIANSWYTINYFKLSFGKQDRLERAAEQILINEGLHIDEKKSQIVSVLKKTQHPGTLKALRYFDGEVPHRFLSPWFSKDKGNKKKVYARSKSFENDCIYAIDEHNIIINPKWIAYLYHNSGILKQFCYWRLGLYLQKHNPNVPDIPNKLIREPKRKSLIKQRKEFWDIVINHHGSLNCIYTKKQLTVGNYAVEHFIPHAFVSHDLMWNLIPADKSFNSRKGDKLPSFDEYFESYYDLQIIALETISSLLPKSKFLEDYLSIIPDLNLMTIDKTAMKDLFKNNIQPLITIAGNNGFEYM
jgi:hypothetical protein